MRQAWTLRDNAVRERFLKEFSTLPDGTSITIKEGKVPRSVAQNATYWMWIADFIKSGKFKDVDGKLYTKDQLHYELASAFLEPVEWTNRNKVKRYTVQSTKDLDAPNFSAYLLKVKELGLAMGVFLRDPAINGLDVK